GAPLAGGEEPLHQAGAAFQARGEPVDLAHVDADPDDHGAPVTPPDRRPPRALTRRSPTWPGSGAGRRRGPVGWPARRRTVAAGPPPAAAGAASTPSAGSPGSKIGRAHV